MDLGAFGESVNQRQPRHGAFKARISVTGVKVKKGIRKNGY